MFDLREEPVTDLREHAGIPSVVDSSSVYDVVSVPSGWRLVERSLAAPLRKNYDQIEDPLAWPEQLRSTDSTLIAAFSAGSRVGGVIVAVAVPGLVSWFSAPGAAVLWDLRVAPACRRKSVGTSLVRAAQTWSQQRGCSELTVETQNTNLAACRFYMHNGFGLQQARRGAYAQLPEEVELIWRKTCDGR